MSTIDQINADVDQLQTSLETFCFQTLNKIQSLKSKLNTLSLHHQQCNLANLDDIRYTTFSVKQVTDMVNDLQSSSIPPHIVINSLHPINDLHNLVVLIATDGSIKARHGRKIAGAAIAFGHGSPLNTSRIVLNTSSTLFPETNAILLALHTAKSHQLTSVLIITDSAAALKFFVASTTANITSSATLQNFLANHPDLQTAYTQFKDLSKNFQYLAIKWQKAHTNSHVYDTYSELNSIADSLANLKVEETLTHIIS